MKKSNHLFAITLLLFLASCQPNYFFDQKIDFADQAWSYSDSLQCTVDITDTSQLFNLYLDIEHTTNYSFQNIYLRINTQFPGGERLSEVVPIDLMSSVGQWYGNCNSEACDLRVVIQEGAFFNALGKHTFTIEQFMRRDPLKEIQSIAFRMEDTQKSK